MHAVAGEEVLPAAGVAGALPDRDQVEDRPDVAEERIVALTGERLRGAAVEGGDRLRRERVVVGGRARADVVRRRRPLRDHRRLATLDARDRERLGGVAEEVGTGLRLELEPVDHVRLHVAVRVDLDVVPGSGRERVPVRPRGRILARDHVREQRDRVRLVRAPERVADPSGRRTDPPRSGVPPYGWRRGSRRARSWPPQRSAATTRASAATSIARALRMVTPRCRTAGSEPCSRGLRAGSDRPERPRLEPVYARRRTRGDECLSSAVVALPDPRRSPGRCAGISLISRTRRSSRSSHAATSRRSRSCTTAAAGWPTASPSASSATTGSPRTPCRRRS